MVNDSELMIMGMSFNFEEYIIIVEGMLFKKFENKTPLKINHYTVATYIVITHLIIRISPTQKPYSL